MTPPLATFEDATLIKLAIAGRSDCFTALMDRHLFAVKRRIGTMVTNITDRDDVLQEVVFKVWLHLSTFRSDSSFRTWMTRVAINEALQSFRREQHRPVCQPFCDFDTLASSGESPHQALARMETAQAVRRAVVGLPSKYRQVLILHDLEQRTTQETARSLQSSISAVKTRLHRARRMLSKALVPHKKRVAQRTFLQ
jgi:RNA polymerase sigma-70 factor (ECF subfamily)